MSGQGIYIYDPGFWYRKKWRSAQAPQRGKLTEL